jgi:hypothetical protein
MSLTESTVGGNLQREHSGADFLNRPIGSVGKYAGRRYMHKRGQANRQVDYGDLGVRLTNAGGTADSLIRPGIRRFCVPGFFNC